MMIRRAVIQAGGEGTRLRPVTLEIPKPLVPVRGQAIATWQVRWFARYGVQEILVIIPPKWIKAFEKWKRDLMEEASAAQETLPSIELWVEPEPMGTMGAFVHRLQDWLGGEPLFITNADELKSFNLTDLCAAYEAQKGKNAQLGMTMALREVPNPHQYGVATLENELIVQFEEKPAEPKSNVINTGLYAADPMIFREIENAKTFLMVERDLFPWLVDQRRLGGCVLEGQWFDCGTLERWETAINEWKG